MTRSSNHADKKINRSEMKYEMKRKRWWTQPLEDNARNITAYELIPDLQRDLFVVRDHVP